LSEGFIEKFADSVNWEKISEYQILSERFICLFAGKVDWEKISRYQKLSPAFIHDFSSKIDPEVVKYNWRSKSMDEKKKLVGKYYEIINIEDIEYVICYKIFFDNYTSAYDYHEYRFDDPLKIYKTKCDYYSNNNYGRGFYCWTHENAVQNVTESLIEKYRIITVICPLENICMLENRQIRAEQMKFFSPS
jgi:hypothetical protein